MIDLMEILELKDWKKGKCRRAAGGMLQGIKKELVGSGEVVEEEGLM